MILKTRFYYNGKNGIEFSKITIYLILPLFLKAGINCQRVFTLFRVIKKLLIGLASAIC